VTTSSSSTHQIGRVSTVTIKHLLQVPIYYGDWVMRHREFALVRVELNDGTCGFAYGLTRDGPIAELVARSVAPRYLGKPVADPAALFFTALWSNHAVHAAGVGLRALSIVDLATWDALARSQSRPIHDLLAPERPRIDLPATAIVGYPPSTSAEDTAVMVEKLAAQGWTRFKLPIAPTLELTVERLAAARSVAPQAWVGFDANYVFRSADEVLAFERSVRHLRLGWIEDLIPPGDAHELAKVRAGSVTLVATGDEQGGSYHPQALLDNAAVDVLRVDATTNGGITGLRRVIAQAAAAGVAISPHMFPHIHSRLLGAFGIPAPIEWGVIGTGVHPMDDSLEQPTIVNGAMRPLTQSPGFGDLVNVEWIAEQEVTDPDSVLDEYAVRAGQS
jgi:L-alanine-DL-glutamate epimerase-like enolase superfamily enzyme